MNASTVARSLSLAAALAASPAVLAANDGSLGASSSGDLQVTMSVADRVQVTRLDDIVLGGYGGTGDMVGAEAFCAYRNGTGLYALTLSSANALAGQFRASNGPKFISYVVRIDDDTDASDGALTTSGATRTGLAGSGTSVSCGAADNAAVEITFAEADLQGAAAGAYADTLTLLVEPN
ncbi:MAG TPA: hypothetical protein VLA56_11565 [Pseudomonadales bacterium]|nr:hypothetical protein [Pseudomonadales bacterium]